MYINYSGQTNHANIIILNKTTKLDLCHRKREGTFFGLECVIDEEMCFSNYPKR